MRTLFYAEILRTIAGRGKVNMRVAIVASDLHLATHKVEEHFVGEKVQVLSIYEQTIYHTVVV